MEEIKIVVDLPYSIVETVAYKLEVENSVTIKVVVTIVFVSGTQAVVLM